MADLADWLVAWAATAGPWGVGLSAVGATSLQLLPVFNGIILCMVPLAPPRPAPPPRACAAPLERRAAARPACLDDPSGRPGNWDTSDPEIGTMPRHRTPDKQLTLQLPGQVLGAMWGSVTGVAVASCAACTAAVACLLISRHGLRELIGRHAGRNALMDAVGGSISASFSKSMLVTTMIRCAPRLHSGSSCAAARRKPPAPSATPRPPAADLFAAC
jgi:hypothetical protein